MNPDGKRSSNIDDAPTISDKNQIDAGWRKDDPKKPPKWGMRLAHLSGDYPVWNPEDAVWQNPDGSKTLGYGPTWVNPDGSRSSNINDASTTSDKNQIAAGWRKDTPVSPENMEPARKINSLAHQTETPY
jgi:hypothetical protein